MVARDLRQVTGELVAGDRWQEEEEEEDQRGCMFGNIAPMKTMLQGHGQNIKCSVEISGKLLQRGGCEEQSFEPASATTESGHVEKHTRKKHKVGPSAGEVRLINKYLETAARPLEEGIDEEAIRKLVKSSTFKKFVHRSELEDEVLELHQQLQQELELHTSLEMALAHASGESPSSVPLNLHVNAQRLLSDIAMLEVAVLKLETQTTALQWEIVHERRERKVIEYGLTLNPTESHSFKILRNSPRHIASSSRETPTATLPQCELSEASSPSVRHNSPATPNSTLNNLLRTPSFSTVGELSEQRVSTPQTPPKSPRRGLRNLWSGQDPQPQPQSPTSPSFFKDWRALIPQLRITYPTTPEREQMMSPSSSQSKRFFSSPIRKQPLLFSTSPFTPVEEPVPTSPVTPDSTSVAAEHRRQDLSNLLPSAKRLAFWNFTFEDDATAPATPILEQGRVPCIQTEDRRAQELGTSTSIFDSPSSSKIHKSEDPYSAHLPSRPKQRTSRSPQRSKLDKESELIAWPEPPKDANRLSEEMVRCMLDIYYHLAEPGGEPMASPGRPLSPSSHTGQFSDYSPSSLSESSVFANQKLQEDHLAGCEANPDPYEATGKLPWADIGPYRDCFEVSGLSIRREQLQYVAHALGNFRVLVERLTKVDPSGMTHEQKLAFWINLYNALLMHAFLAYGIPRNDLKFFTLTQKAAYCVGGQWFNAAIIEHCLLKGKVMAHRPQFALFLALHKNKLTDEQRKYGIDRVESKVNFALSCGARSSPMVRIYKPESLYEELDAALRDYVRASVGMTDKGKLLIPKLVYNYARDFVEDIALMDWVCNHLPASQVAALHDRMQQHEQRRRRRLLNNSPTFAIVPFNFKFRYLFPAAAGKTPPTRNNSSASCIDRRQVFPYT